MHCASVEKPQFLPLSLTPPYCAHQGYSIAAAGRARTVMAAMAIAAKSTELSLVMTVVRLEAGHLVSANPRFGALVRSAANFMRRAVSFSVPIADTCWKRYRGVGSRPRAICRGHSL